MSSCPLHLGALYAMNLPDGVMCHVLPRKYHNDAKFNGSIIIIDLAEPAPGWAKLMKTKEAALN